MALRYRLSFLLRGGYRILLVVVVCLSLCINFLLLLPTDRKQETFPVHNDICAAILNNAGGEKVMEFIERNREIESSVKSAFVSQINWCLQNGEYSYSSVRNIDSILRHLNSLQSQQSVTSVHMDQSNSSSSSLSSKHSTNNSRDKIELFLSQPIINPHEFPYIFNQSQACSDHKLKFIIAVPSSPGNFKNRMKVRENRGGKFSRDPANRAKLLFFLGTAGVESGRDESKSVQSKIESEQKLYGDLVQADFVDSYRNLTKKAALILRWSRQFCRGSTFVLRMDDDLRVDLSKMTAAMEDTMNSNKIGPHFILGNVVSGWGPVRDRKSKYFTSLDEFPYKKLPDFILGGAMGYSTATADLLFRAYQRLPPFWLDDVFVTAMCAPRVGVVIKNSTAFRFEHWKW